MIVFLSRRAHAYTIWELVGVWAPALRRRVRLLAYEDLAHTSRLPAATYVFADLERLSPALGDLAAEVRDQLATKAPSLRLLNHPRRSLRRFELQQALRREGRAPFAVHRLADPPGAWRFPVFLRRESRHSGSLTPLLHSVEQVRSAASLQVERGGDSQDLLVVEFCDTADRAGFYRRYGVHRFGDRLVADSVAFSRDWVVKYSPELDEEHRAEELRFLEQNPHEQELRPIFALAGIEYGRIDYTVLDGRIVVWEINTNPFLVYPPDCYAPEKLADEEKFARRLEAAFDSMDDSSADGKLAIPIHVSTDTIRRLWPSPIARLCRLDRVADDQADTPIMTTPPAIRRPIARLWRSVRRAQQRFRTRA
jgi:hypothetical protein